MSLIIIITIIILVQPCYLYEVRKYIGIFILNTNNILIIEKVRL
jgi:hypothetical protein